MRLLPAIDIRGGRCVRLLKGDFGRETRYEADPRDLARRYLALGADWLHVVDLDGAASGKPVNSDLVAQIRKTRGLRIQLGGGIRDRRSLEAAGALADRLVIGSLAVTEPAEVAAWLAELGPDRITLAFDVRYGDNGIPYVTTHGWMQASRLSLAAAIEPFLDAGLRHVLCTDVDRDGALSGPNVELYRDCVRSWPMLAFQASGGVRDAADLDALADTGVAAAICGKALLESRITDGEIRRFSPNA